MIRFEQILAELDVDESYDAEPQNDQDDGLYPEYCPFCGAHDSEEDDDSDE